MRTIQYYHKRNVTEYVFEGDDFKVTTVAIESKGGTTVALEVPSVEEFKSFEVIDATQEYWEYRLPTIELEAGLAKCSDEDNYNKKIGRQIATGRMETRVFWARRHTENEVLLVPTQGKFPSLILRKETLADGVNERIYLVGVK